MIDNSRIKGESLARVRFDRSGRVAWVPESRIEEWNPTLEDEEHGFGEVPGEEHERCYIFAEGEWLGPCNRGGASPENGHVGTHVLIMVVDWTPDGKLGAWCSHEGDNLHREEVQLCDVECPLFISAPCLLSTLPEHCWIFIYVLDQILFCPAVPVTVLVHLK